MNGFLIDECLSVVLVRVAQDRGYAAASVAGRGLRGRPDPDIVRTGIANGLVVVTNDWRDYRRLYLSLDTHPGLVVIRPNRRIRDQVLALEAILDRFDGDLDPTDRMLTYRRDGTITLQHWTAASSRRSD